MCRKAPFPLLCSGAHVMIRVNNFAFQALFKVSTCTALHLEGEDQSSATGIGPLLMLPFAPVQLSHSGKTLQFPFISEVFETAPALKIHAVDQASYTELMNMV